MLTTYRVRITGRRSTDALGETVRGELTVEALDRGEARRRLERRGTVRIGSAAVDQWTIVKIEKAGAGR